MKKNLIISKNKIKDAILGFIVGDAMGVPTEFLQREKLQNNKVTDMIADNDNFGLPKGSWSDDTSMMVATMDSIINRKGIDYNDIMNNFVRWLNNGEYTPTGKVFDVGRTCLRAIIRYKREEQDPTKCGLNSFINNGNGSLMRILPIILYCHYNEYNNEDGYQIIKDASSLTHGHEISIMGCYIYSLYFKYLLEGLDKYEAYLKVKEYNYGQIFKSETIKIYERILINDISKLELNDINSSGYIVSTLESILWSFLRGDNYKDVIITTINLGQDTDTIAAITGALTGLYYGDIPNNWINNLQRKEYVEDIIDKFILELERGCNYGNSKN